MPNGVILRACEGINFTGASEAIVDLRESRGVFAVPTSGRGIHVNPAPHASRSPFLF